MHSCKSVVNDRCYSARPGSNVHRVLTISLVQTQSGFPISEASVQNRGSGPS